ncbi:MULTISPECIES: response regulator [unclassified Rhizobium]|jgi:CheY-like chemotaxis protein|uniref:response regulator n=1 Tax=unclassified Rhizobium TaxID=2613769 RepID=UPI000647CF7B|nr:MULTISPECIES: response regulator [unclassified Rhizobium]MBN8954193.1 response regulator [Rhizobium tropici]OJY70914.1 MAG: histidine kinase [Rhizobium sp. 60-20]RKD50727.1 signal transduction histidine kinase [Rhizobium sp. WW_1]
MSQSATSKVTKWNLGLDPVVAFSLVGAIVFFLISGAFAYINTSILRENTDKIVRSHAIMIALDELLSSAQDAETGQRGFLLTNNERYLDPYNSALNAVPQRLREIEELTADNAAQQRRVAILQQHVDAKLAELKQTIDLRKAQSLDAALAVVNSDQGKVEMDAIRAQLFAMGQSETELRSQRLDEMNDAYHTALVGSVLTGALGILLTIVMGLLIRRTTLTRRREEWLQSGNLGLASALVGDQRTEQLGDNILGYLTRYVGAVAGAIFVRDRDTFRRVSTYGVPEGAALVERFGLREGLLGQAVVEESPIVIDEVPAGYLTFGSALGSSNPNHLVISPGSVDGDVNAVIELGFLRPADEAVLEFLERASSSIATAVRSAKYRSDLINLLEETQRQSEELQVQGEELRVSNEELEEQGRALKESHMRLEQQQTELEQTNSQLEEQAQQLETQRDDLERANTSIQLKAQELEQASRYKSDFLANMSHELRTPLNSSLILAKLLADNTDENLTQEQVKYAQTIQSSGNDLLNLINDILDLSKIEAGHADIRLEQVSIKRLSNNIRQLFEPVAGSKGITFEIKIADECPAIIETDLQRLEQVVKNLLSNAFKFTEQGHVTVSINGAGDNRIAIAVSDTGIGIAEDQQRRIFEAFHQADGTISRRFGGTGLGLSISKELVRLLGGNIQLESREGQGSTFTLTLPLTYTEAVDATRERIATGVSAPSLAPAASDSYPLPPRSRPLDDDRAISLGDKRVLLVVEDDDAFAEILRDLAREVGFRALVATTAHEAIALASQFVPNAIVLDVGLPDQSGLSVLDRLKRDVQTRHIPIHMVSADDYSETAFALGAMGYMLKPVKREQLVDVLKGLERKLSQRLHRVLIVEDNEVQREAVAKLLTSHEVETVGAGTAAECLRLLKEEIFDCMVLDLSLPDASGYALLEKISQDGDHAFPPVIVYTGHVLSPDDERKLRRYSKSIIIKGAKSPERLLDEVTLFLHQVVSDLPAEQQRMIRKARSRDALLEGRRILIVEDDVRNVYALTNILEPRGAEVQIARNGQEAIDALKNAALGSSSAIDLVLMDVMMPVMDGLAATREIRLKPEWRKLPIIALTAKAMPDDQQRCIEAGANDYMAKPLDVEKLLSLVRVWMPR